MTYHQERLLTYSNPLHPWSIVRMMPQETKDAQVIIRFRRRQDAEAHIQILRSKNPTVAYELMFDITSTSELTTKQELTPVYATQG